MTIQDRVWKALKAAKGWLGQPDLCGLLPQYSAGQIHHSLDRLVQKGTAVGSGPSTKRVYKTVGKHSGCQVIVRQLNVEKAWDKPKTKPVPSGHPKPEAIHALDQAWGFVVKPRFNRLDDETSND